MSHYYNEIDPHAAAWLRNLIAAGHLTAGVVDERSILDVDPADLDGYGQCHFFAGIGGWPYALRLAGWPDDRPVWTGSCPCQPLSSAGQRKGHADERHLWPAFYRLIAERRPATVFGEQVAGALGREWLAGIRADLEGAGYAIGAADLCAASLGAPHIRQRLFWVADTQHAIGRALDDDREHGCDGPDAGRTETHGEPGACGKIRGLADADGWKPWNGDLQPGGQQRQQPQDGGARGLADPQRDGRQGDERRPGPRGEPEPAGRGGLGDAESNDGPRSDICRAAEWREKPPRSAGAWGAAEWLPCLDGKARRAEPGIFPLAYGVSGRVGRLRAYGNAIIPQVAAEFVAAVMACRP